MPLAVVAYPALAPGDQPWIDATRATHDPRARFIRAHFTLVFPVEIARFGAVKTLATYALRPG